MKRICIILSGLIFATGCNFFQEKTVFFSAPDCDYREVLVCELETDIFVTSYITFGDQVQPIAISCECALRRNRN